jgi:hypothetical protein
MGAWFHAPLLVQQRITSEPTIDSFGVHNAVRSYLNIHPQNVFEIISVFFTIKNPAFSKIARNVTDFDF